MPIEECYSFVMFSSTWTLSYPWTLISPRALKPQKLTYTFQNVRSHRIKLRVHGVRLVKVTASNPKDAVRNVTRN